MLYKLKTENLRRLHTTKLEHILILHSVWPNGRLFDMSYFYPFSVIDIYVNMHQAGAWHSCEIQMFHLNSK